MTDGPGSALGDGDATSVAAAVGDGLADGLTDGEAAGVVHATTSAPINKATGDRITRQYAVKRLDPIWCSASRCLSGNGNASQG
jgi:hypothetical protein